MKISKIKIRNLWNRARSLMCHKDKKKEASKKACRESNCKPRIYVD